MIEHFRTDASAEGETVTVGGYQSHTDSGLPIAYSEAKWYLLTLDRKCAPWAYERGEPFRSIASLQLLGTFTLASKVPTNLQKNH